MRTKTFSGWMYAAVIILSFAFVAVVQGDERAECHRLAASYGCPDLKRDLEYRLWDDSRVDFFPFEAPWNEYAIEVDWAYKWKEGCTQALYFHHLTGRKPGLILLTKDRRGDARHLFRAQIICTAEGIKMWVEDVEDE